MSYGMDRVLEPQQVLPTSAWKLDNSRKIKPKEIRISIKKIHIEGTSFRQLCQESNNNDKVMGQKIIDITIKRGKLHNPVTDTGGLLYGIVEEIGKEYSNPKNLKVGDEVLCNASLASIPTSIVRVGEIDRAYNQIEAEGYAIAYENVPIIPKPVGLPIDLMLVIFNESGTLYRVGACAPGKESVLVIGTNLMMTLIYGYAARKIIGEKAHIVGFVDKKTNTILKGGKVDRLIRETFDKLSYVNILKPINCMETLEENAEFDMVINCAEIPGAETLAVLCTKYGGTTMLTNLINNYNIALYITEALSKEIEIRTAEGYLAKYDDFDMVLIGELAAYFEGSTAETKNRISLEKELLNSKGYTNSKAEGFISESLKMSMVLEEIKSVAKYDCNVLITGDTGVGKEKVANIIQKNSIRNMQPFIKVNCAAISPNLIESEFFGYEGGAFTGANTSGKKGYFELADNGIVFLDEVGELPLDMQAKLLRVIQDGEFFRVGGSRPVKTNVRIISATNRDLEKRVEDKEFRRDLYYRLNVFPIKVPSLNERKDDIIPLTKYFLKEYCEKFGIERGIDEDALDYLKNLTWPGNIRELENFVQRMLISAKGMDITIMDVMREIHGDIFGMGVDFQEDGAIEMVSTSAFAGIEKDEEGRINLNNALEKYEKQLIAMAMDKYGTTRKAANALSISQTQLVRKKNKYFGERT